MVPPPLNRIDPPRPALSGKDQGSFAYETIKDRLPIILTKVINDINQTVFKLDPLTHSFDANQGKWIIQQLSGLRYKMQRDQTLSQLNDHLPDAHQWNHLIAQYSPNATHFKVPWLLQECYMYRFIVQLFHLSLSDFWTHYDPFRASKIDSLTKSLPVLLAIADQFANDAHLHALPNLILFSLWGNSVDLSLLAGSDTTDTHLLGAKIATPRAADNIVVNDLNTALEYILTLSRARIDFILDNAGFELTSDLFLADSLVTHGHASTVVFHIKAHPWFVSDVTQFDFEYTLTILATSMPDTIVRWRDWLDLGVWQVRVDPFWTYPVSFYYLPQFPIAQDLALSDLVVFKGDLNYRKLVFDCQWELGTPFVDAIGPLGSAFPPLLALRTCKSEVCVGLSAGMVQQLSVVRDWCVSGKYAVISFKL